MPRRRTPEPVVPVSTALVASVTRYPGKVDRIYRPQQNWQAECYRHYAICGEARFAAKFFGNSVSRATLSVQKMNGPHPEAVESGPAFDAQQELWGGEQNQSQMLAAIGTHLTIAGECYLVGRSADDGDLWEVVSCMEMRVSGDTWTINYGNGLPAVELTDQDVVLRIWLPSPSRQVEADSPFRSLLPILSEIEWLTRHVFSQITSRLAGSGILMMPQSMTFPPPPAPDGQEVAASNDADTFMATLADAMMKPIEDPGNPSAVVPIVVTAPDDAIANARLLQFWSELDANSMQLRGEAIRRFALGMDLPPEQILGMSSRGGGGLGGAGGGNPISHWGAWQVEESTIKLHIEPMLDVICQALTTGYLIPLVDDGSFFEYDTSALRLRPDRSKEAFELWDRGLITAETLRRENGFSEDDAPDAAEMTKWLLLKVATGSSTPDQVGAALKALGVVLDAPQVPALQAPRETPQPPTLDEHPTKPRTPAESALVAASEALVFRALERAGNRLRAQGTRPAGVPAYEIHLYAKGDERCLEDAWSCAGKVLDGVADPDTVIPVLNSYCASLIAERSPHKRERLVNWLRLANQVSA